MSDPLAWLRSAAEARAAAGMRRTLRPRHGHEDVLDFASNDYLGLTRDPRVTDAAAAAAREWGGGSTGSRLVTGSTTLHAELERTLAEFVGAPAGLVFSSGYLANLGVLTALTDPDTLVVSDAANHASIVDACRLSRASVVIASHCDVSSVERILARRTESKAVVITDAVFSVDGDLAPVAALYDVARAHGALLVVDEAHSLGVLGDGGRGAVAAAGIAAEPDVVVTLTLSKSLAAQGGAVLADPVVIEHLVNTARPFIFDTGLAPAPVGAALAALGVLREEPHRAEQVRANARALSTRLRERGLAATTPDGAVVSVPVGDPGRALTAAQHCLDSGVRVGCFRPPSVPDTASRLRLTARATHTAADLDRAVEVVATALG